MSSKVPKFSFEDYPPAKPAKVANLYPHRGTPGQSSGVPGDLCGDVPLVCIESMEP